ncbi:SAF domain-containing protein [Streptomyces sp. NBC_01549]|uniref:SAF domain-containing protein n=1 Tax=unclassified Streptomyces TaxID=2593676 RepID=UPI0022547047|nr:SAF domain-containing protein [Streptomyces sp. NBC_01549]MCX4596819.1 SAF domain-containing protein [Streptomyces sp. NBC_01549]
METPAAPTVPRPQGPARPAIPITTTPPVKRQRRWSVAALCIVLAVVAALGAAAAVNSASDRTRVLAVARDVPAGRALTDSDLAVAEVSADSALTPIPASQKASVLGRRSAVDLRKGGLLLTSQLGAGTGLGDNQEQVGVQIKRGMAPSGTLAPGDKVRAVTTPAQGDEPAKKGTVPETIDATVVSVSRPDATGTVVVNLAVAPDDGPVLASRAALGRIALVREPRSN